MRKANTPQLAETAVRYLKANSVITIGGLITGLADDTAEDIEENYRFLHSLRCELWLDQIMTPYPKTVTRQEYTDMDLVTNPDDFRWYNGYWANVRTRHLSPEEIQFHRWRCRTKWSPGRHPTKVLRNIAAPFYYFKKLIDLPVIQPVRAWRRYRGMTEKERFQHDTNFLLHVNDFAHVHGGPFVAEVPGGVKEVVFEREDLRERVAAASRL
jgi:hypothetical protein